MFYRTKFIIGFCIFFCFSFQAYSQQPRFSFQFHKTSLNDVIGEVLFQSKMNSLYNTKILPPNISITGNFKNLTLTQALDTFLRNTPVLYKLYKNTIVFYRRSEEVREVHHASKPILQKKGDNQHYLVTDTVTYSIVQRDTIVTTLTSYEKIQIKDTIKVYDTIVVVKNKARTDWYEKNNKQSFAIGVSFSEGYLSSKINSENLTEGYWDMINSALQSKDSKAVNFKLAYKYKRFICTMGIGYQENTYLFYFSYITSETNQEKKYHSNLNYHHITFPFLIGYSIDFSKIAFQIKVGAILNNYIGSQGSYLNLSGTNLNVESIKAPNPKFTLSPMIAIGIDYSLNKRINISFFPYFMSNNLPLRKPESIYYFTTNQLGLDVGVHLFLMKK